MRTHSSQDRFFRPGLRIPEEAHLQTSYVVDNRTWNYGTEAKHHILNDMRQSLAEHLVHARMESRDYGDFSKEIRLDVYIFNPDEFDELVEAEIQRRMSLIEPKVMPNAL